MRTTSPAHGPIPRRATARDTPLATTDAERRLRRAQATIDGLLLTVPALREQVGLLRAENERLHEQLLRLEDAAGSTQTWRVRRPPADRAGGYAP